MEFDKSRVCTAVYADILNKGDLCFFADTLADLKDLVNDGVECMPLSRILAENCTNRFVYGTNTYCLTYLVCPVRNVEAYKAWNEGKAVEISYNGGKTWILFKRENDDRAPDWCIADYRPAEEKPKEKKYRPFKNCKELLDFWYIKTAANVPSYGMPLIWVKRIDDSSIHLLAYYWDIGAGTGIYSFDLQEMFEKYTFLDGTPCGVEE